MYIDVATYFKIYPSSPFFFYPVYHLLIPLWQAGAVRFAYQKLLENVLK
jgi:hypothetical protein